MLTTLQGNLIDLKEQAEGSFSVLMFYQGYYSRRTFPPNRPPRNTPKPYRTRRGDARVSPLSYPEMRALVFGEATAQDGFNGSTVRVRFAMFGGYVYEVHSHGYHVCASPSVYGTCFLDGWDGAAACLRKDPRYSAYRSA